MMNTCANAYESFILLVANILLSAELMCCVRPRIWCFVSDMKKIIQKMGTGTGSMIIWCTLPVIGSPWFRKLLEPGVASGM